MFTKKTMLRAAGASLAVVLSLAAQPLRAQGSDAERLQKLEQAVSQLQKRNAELEQEISSLKKHAATEPVAGVGKTKTEVTYDGKTYVEKTVPVDKSSADKWKLSTSITEMELYGDLRLRYEYRGGRTDDTPVAPPAPGVAGTHDWQERERERYRLRLGLRGTLLDDWFFGLRLETNASARSTNVTFGADTSSSSPGGGGPFAKGDDTVYVGQAYGGYKGFPGFTFTGGRMPNPLVTTLMVWDPDINPEGLAEQYKHTFTIGGGAAAPASYSKDGKNVAPPPPSEPFLKIDVFANFAQFVYNGNVTQNPLGLRPTVSSSAGSATNQTGQLIPNSDAFLLAWQVGAKFDFSKKFYFQLAPTLYNYTGNGNVFNIHYQGGSPDVTNAESLAQNQTGINSLLVFDLPAEIGWKMWGVPTRVFGDFAVNFEADDRANAAGHPGKGGDRYAYQIGLGIGQLKKKHDWEISAWWQHQDQYSLDPNLVDSDLFDSQLNLQGVAVRAGYMLADAVVFNLTYAYAWQIDDALGTGGNGDISINPLNQYQIFQADLSFKF
jgi:hypothetical protein